METVLERNTIENAEMQQHNAMISERYRRLLDVVEDQLSAPVVEEQTYTPTILAPQAPAYDTTPTVEQTPTVTQYVPVNTVEAPVVETNRTETIAPTAQVQVQTQARVSVQAKATVVAQYSLTPFAKIMMAAFVFVVTAMLVLIGVNSALIRQGKVRLRNLEEQKQELHERSEEIQRRIQELQTEESILERAEQAGLLG